MSKRFMDTGLIRKRWFKEMSPTEKSAFVFLVMDCDAVGVWEVDTKTADFLVGASIDWPSLTQACNGNIVKISDKKWWLRDFCNFQYGRIPESGGSKVHSHLRILLNKHGLWKQYIESRPESVPESTLDSKEKEKEKVKDKEWVRPTIDRSAPPNPSCKKCGRAMERDHGYWSCKEHGKDYDA